MSLEEALEMYNVIALVRPIFNNENKYYLELYLEECLYKLAEKLTKKYNVKIIFKYDNKWCYNK